MEPNSILQASATHGPDQGTNYKESPSSHDRGMCEDGTKCMNKFQE